jgi:hypothetical protein
MHPRRARIAGTPARQGAGGPLERLRLRSSGSLASRLCGCLKDAIDIYDHIRFEGDERGKSSVLFAIWYLIDVASGIKLQNKDHLACLIYIINKPVFAKSYPESGLMAFALFNIKIG